MTTPADDTSASRDAPLSKWEEGGLGCAAVVLASCVPVAHALFSESALTRWYWAAVTTVALLGPLWVCLKARRHLRRGQGQGPEAHKSPPSESASQ